MDVVNPLKVPSLTLMTCSDIFKFNPSSANRSRPMNILYLPLAESSTWNFHITAFVVISAGKVKSTLTLVLVVIFPAVVCHYITESFSGFRFSTSLPITIAELHKLSNRIWNLLNFASPFLLFMHPFRMRE